jgi:hypothetical protein
MLDLFLETFDLFLCFLLVMLSSKLTSNRNRYQTADLYSNYLLSQEIRGRGLTGDVLQRPLCVCGLRGVFH